MQLQHHSGFVALAAALAGEPRYPYDYSYNGRLAHTTSPILTHNKYDMDKTHKCHQRSA